MEPFASFGQSHAPLPDVALAAKHEAETIVLASKLAQALNNSLQKQEPQEAVISPAVKKLKTSKPNIFTAFVSDIVFGTKKELATGEEIIGYNNMFREMVKGQRSKIPAFRDIHSEKIEIGLSNAPNSPKIVAIKFTKEVAEHIKPMALIITGSFNAPEVYAAPLVKAYLDEGLDVLVIDPVGFGASQQAGSPSPENFLQSAEAAARYIREGLHIPNRFVVVHGYSIGVFAAAHVASLKVNDGMSAVLDRGAKSAEAVAIESVQASLPGVLGDVGAKVAGAIVHAAVHYDLKETLPNIHGKVFLAQTDLTPEELASEKKRKKGSSAYGFVESQQKKHKLDDVKITKVLEAGEHITSYSETWTRKPSSQANIQFKAWLHEVIAEEATPMDLT
jgi:pimeloyl-ACP methyl ester carboxylesterase